MIYRLFRKESANSQGSVHGNHLLTRVAQNEWRGMISRHGFTLGARALTSAVCSRRLSSHFAAVRSSFGNGFADLSLFLRLFLHLEDFFLP